MVLALSQEITMSNQKYLAASALLASLLASHGAFAGMVKDSHGNVGYDTLAECDAAVNAGTAKFYQPFTKKSAVLRAGETRTQVMTLKDLVIPQETVKSMNYQASDYKRGACEIGLGPKAGQNGVSQSLQGKYVPYSPDMPVNVYFNKVGQPVRATMKQCDNRFAANMPRPIPQAPVAMKAPAAPVANAPAAVTAPAAVVAPVAPAPVQAAIGAAQGSLGWKEALGIAGVLAVGAILVHNNGDTGTTGTTGTR
jgi:hypothetical protein